MMTMMAEQNKILIFRCWNCNKRKPGNIVCSRCGAILRS